MKKSAVTLIPRVADPDRFYLDSDPTLEKKKLYPDPIVEETTRLGSDQILKPGSISRLTSNQDPIKTHGFGLL